MISFEYKLKLQRQNLMKKSILETQFFTIFRKKKKMENLTLHGKKNSTEK